MNTQTNIQAEDVIQVAQSIKKGLSPEEVQEIISLYPNAEKEDPTANWSEIVEQLIYDIKNR